MVAGLLYAQPGIPENGPPPVVESPEASSHGKMISELARTTPGGPEKGKIISSAARQKSLEVPGAARRGGPSHGQQAASEQGRKGIGHTKTLPSQSSISASNRGKPPGVGLMK
jgi:hypothetical protein